MTDGIIQLTVEYKNQQHIFCEYSSLFYCYCNKETMNLNQDWDIKNLINI